jgi:hypothetical protein
VFLNGDVQVAELLVEVGWRPERPAMSQPRGSAGPPGASRCSRQAG